MVRITTDARRGYWLVAITCKDRNKLLFDTVCTLADMQYDVFHATIDSQGGVAMQEYWIKSCNGSCGAHLSLFWCLATGCRHLQLHAESCCTRQHEQCSVWHATDSRPVLMLSG